jgi:hypothetical protein
MQSGQALVGVAEKRRSQKTVQPFVHWPQRVFRDPGRHACSTPYGTQRYGGRPLRSRTLCVAVT